MRRLSCVACENLLPLCLFSLRCITQRAMSACVREGTVKTMHHFARLVAIFMSACVFGVACGKGPGLANRGPETCTNKVDDNQDGKVDCSDPQCADVEACLAPVELCDNDVDDNADGAIDCSDSQCHGQSCGPQCTCIGGVKVINGQGGGAGGGTGGGGDSNQPDPFSFVDVTGADATVVVTSEAITPTGFTGPLELHCSGCSSLGKNGVFGGTTVSGVMPGDTIAVRATSLDYGQTLTVTVTFRLQ